MFNIFIIRLTCSIVIDCFMIMAPEPKYRYRNTYNWCRPAADSIQGHCVSELSLPQLNFVFSGIFWLCYFCDGTSCKS